MAESEPGASEGLGEEGAQRVRGLTVGRSGSCRTLGQG